MKDFRGHPCKCDACKKCVIDLRTGRCFYSGPYRYVQKGPWYDAWAEKLRKEMYK